MLNNIIYTKKLFTSSLYNRAYLQIVKLFELTDKYFECKNKSWTPNLYNFAKNKKSNLSHD